MPRATRLIPAAWLVLLLVAPGVAWLAGVRQPNLTNAPKAEFPVVNRSSVRSEATFKQAEAAILDRLPFRARSLRTKARISVSVFGESTNPDVIIGRDGWLFFEPELWTCDKNVPRQPADAMELMTRTLVESKRRTAVVISGSKVVQERRRIKNIDARRLDCVTALERDVSARLGATPGGIDLDAELTAMRERGQLPFRPRDTHWSAAGRLAYARAVLDTLRPGVLTDIGLGISETRSETALDDLSGMLPIPTEEQVPVLQVQRPAKIPGPVLVLGDSQSDAVFGRSVVNGQPFGQRALPGMTFCHVNNIETGQCDADLRAARSVVVQTVARSLPVATAWCSRVVSIAGEGLSGAPGRFTLVADGDERSTLTFRGTPISVRLQAPSGNRTGQPRLLRIPVVRLPAAPAGAAPTTVGLQQATTDPVLAPCASPSQQVEGGALFVPVPAAADLQQMNFTLAAPPGTKLGAPEEILFSR